MTLSFKTLGNELDVLVIGAGLSGIGAAYYLKRDCSDKTFAIVETRSRIGGTWDLFRYPGIRSDSDLFTYGYAFKPWKSSTAIADGGSILNYINEAATENGIDRSICFGVKALESNWISSERRWKVTLECQSSKKTRVIYAKWVLSATGYYDYDEAYAPRFRGIEKFKGNVIHPQFWPEKFDYTGKKIVVIGSGATAITLIPSMTELAEHVTMLQRTPTYVVR